MHQRIHDQGQRHSSSSPPTDVWIVWIPSHTGIGGNDAADAAAKAASNLPTVTNDIGYTVSEICGKLRAAAYTQYSAEFKNLAFEKNWFDPTVYPDGVHPNIPPYLVPLFYRLRTQSLRFNYINMLCLCSEPLNFQHIFSCTKLIPTFVNLRKYGSPIPTSPANFLRKHPVHGWNLAAALCRELNSCPVGHLF
jgi:hypothetical protein